MKIIAQYMKTKDYLNVSESFYSIQGEGQTMGVPSVFIRLGGCNLLCKSDSWICDSIEVWQTSQKTRFSDVLTDEMVRAIRNGAHIIFTGGEPMLHQKSIVDFVKYLKGVFLDPLIIEVETNGTIMPTDDMLKIVKYWNCSPKLNNSGEPLSKRYKPQVMVKISNQQNAIFKFVVSNHLDIEEIFNSYASLFKRNQICLMPAGETQSKLNKTRPMVLDMCKKYFLKYCDRLHIVAWNKKTGV
jgi:7-carboxy-7-deazaguanine synthase